MDSKDPFGKAFHNIRPTELDKVMREKEATFMAHKRATETGLEDVSGLREPELGDVDVCVSLG